MAEFKPAFERVLEHEGGYLMTETPGDRGGQTYAGISRRAHPGWEGWAMLDDGVEMEDATPLVESVRDLYRTMYWDVIQGDRYRSQSLAETVYSCAVLSGPSHAIHCLQRAIDRRLDPDGVLGPQTLAAIDRLPSDASAEVELIQLRLFRARAEHYCTLVRRDPSQRKFLAGWLNRAAADLSAAPGCAR